MLEIRIRLYRVLFTYINCQLGKTHHSKPCAQFSFESLSHFRFFMIINVPNNTIDNNNLHQYILKTYTKLIKISFSVVEL